MIAWQKRSWEERTLLNPAFCATLLWFAARGRESEGRSVLSIDESFMVLPLVLPTSTREALPNNVKTSLPVWLSEHPIEQGRLGERAKALVPFTRTALTFGTKHGLLVLDGTQIKPSMELAKGVKKTMKLSSDEVRACAAKAEFIGKWFARTGPASTVLSLLGVRP